MVVNRISPPIQQHHRQEEIVTIPSEVCLVVVAVPSTLEVFFCSVVVRGRTLVEGVDLYPKKTRKDFVLCFSFSFFVLIN